MYLLNEIMFRFEFLCACFSLSHLSTCQVSKTSQILNIFSKKVCIFLLHLVSSYHMIFSESASRHLVDFGVLND
jgi:hypothetical protein